MKPGLHEGLSNEAYHADDALSSSGLKALWSSPAWFRYSRENPSTSRVLEFGSIAHAIVLGDETVELVEIEADSWRTKAAKEAADEARARGALPMLTKEREQVEAMVEALRADSDASSVLGQPGRIEVSCFCPDPVTGIMLRCRFDKLPDAPDDGVLVVPIDYKTTVDVTRFGHSVETFGYHQSAALYEDILVGLDYCESVRFVFVAQEKTPPYFPGVFDLAPEFVELGRDMNRACIDLYAACKESNHWPGPLTGLNTIHPRGFYADAVAQRITEIREYIA